jgi:RHS repeat-associated protein
LGSIRLSYSDGDGNGTISQSEIIEENHYYPYGLKMRGFNTNVSSLGNSLAQKYRFNGMELDESFEVLNTYDFGARNYDPALGRWMNVDPLAEITMQPYSAFNNNPIYYTDPTGMIAEPPVNGLEWFADDTGEYFWNEGQGSYEHYADPDKTGSNSFQGYYSADEFSEPVGDYSIIFDLSGMKPDDQYDPSNTIWSVAAPMLGYLEKMSAITFSEVKDISDQEKYPGVKIYSSEYMNGAITLGNLIITNPDMESAGTLDHEYGHYLDFKHHFKNDKTQYLKDIGYPSLKSAAGSGVHSQSTTEKRANRLGGEWSGNTYLKNKHRDEK